MADLSGIQRGPRRARRMREHATPVADTSAFDDGREAAVEVFSTETHSLRRTAPEDPAVRDQHVGFREEAHDRFHPDPSDLEEILRQRGDRFPSVSPDRMLSDEELQMTGEEVSEHLRSYAYEDEEEGEEDDDDDGDDDDMDGNGNDNDEEGLPDERDRVTYFDPSALGLKEINNLAHFGVSSHKPGNGVAELLSDDLDKYWQSDGQQPHLLTIHFLRRVEIRAIRFFVDYSQDESYTPTHIVFSAGTGHHDLTQFAEVHLSDPVGWQDVPIADCGGGRDGHSLCCWIVQMEIKENHQNGKDTHIRGIKIFALDEYAAAGGTEATVEDAAATADHRVRTAEDDYQDLLDTLGRMDRDRRYKPGDGGFSSMPDFMRDPELR
ncbi:hypothetical protein VTK73DRAFT_6334 [Phialemonium thermophilum]|uniref:DOC domain-containing protein n=1 Tax=Phialemonium thermophilum TaxID=223376 RepID=A0ABR3WJU8_9PEZI